MGAKSAVIAILTLVVFGILSCVSTCARTDPDFSPRTEYPWDCELVVGNAQSATQVYHCHDPIQDKCFYMPGRQGGALYEIPCKKHAFQELSK